MDATAAVTIAAAAIVVVTADAPTTDEADARADVSNAAPVVPAAPDKIVVIKVDVPVLLAGRNSFPKCLRPVRM